MCVQSGLLGLLESAKANDLKNMLNYYNYDMGCLCIMPIFSISIDKWVQLLYTVYITVKQL